MPRKCSLVQFYADDSLNRNGGRETASIPGDHDMVVTGGNTVWERVEGDGRIGGGAGINA